MEKLVSRKGLLDYMTITGGVLGRLVVSLAYFLIIANALSLEAFGVFATASAVGLVLSRLLAFGFISPVYRTATVRRRLLGVYCGGLIAFGILSLPVIALMAYGLHALFFVKQIPFLIFAAIIAAEVLGWRIVEYVAIINNGLNRFGNAATVVIAGSALRTGAAFGFLLFSSHSLAEWSIWYLASTLLSVAVALLIFLPPLRLRWRFALYPRRMRDALSAAGSEILFYAQSELDKLLVLTLAGPQAAGLYAIAMRVIDLTAIPIRSFNQMLVQSLMRSRAAMTRSRRISIESGIALVSTLGFLAIIAILMLAPLALGRNIASAGALFPLLLAVPALRNLIEYHAELLYAAEMTGRRLLQLATIALLKGGLMTGLLWLGWPIEHWSLALNAVFAALYAASLALVLRWLPSQQALVPKASA